MKTIPPPPEIKYVKTSIFSTGVRDIDIRQYYEKSHVPVCNDWQTIITRLMEMYRHAKVAVYPMASMQIGYVDEKDLK